jgi:hypothetical protein
MGATHYSLEKNIGLGKLIVETASRLNLIMRDSYSDDPRVRKEVPKFYPTPPGLNNPTMHADHFHVYLNHPNEAKGYKGKK